MALVKSPFAIIPWEVAADTRLTSRHLRVLIALLSFRSQDTGPFWATREQIQERSGLPLTRISAVTTELEGLGWLRKEGKGRVATRYFFTVPTVTNPVTVTEMVTDTKTDTVTVTKSVTQQSPTGVTLLDPSDTPSETQEGLPEWLDKVAWLAWEIHRKEIRKKLTPKAVQLQLKFLAEHKSEQLQIIEQSIRNSWTGLFELRNENGTSKKLSASERVRAETGERARKRLIA